MRRSLIAFLLIATIADLTRAGDPVVTPSSGPFPIAPIDGACVDSSSACRQSIPPEPPAWEVELQKAQTAWGSCQKEVDRYCEGVQVGEGRIENCLKQHRAQLSRSCRKAQ